MSFTSLRETPLHRPEQTTYSGSKGPLRIALVSYLFSKSATGLSTYISDLVTRLCDDGHRVTVIGTDCGYRGGDSGDLTVIDHRAVLKVFQVSGRWNRRLYRSTALVRWLKNHVTEFDVVDIQGVWSWIAADVAAVCRKAGVSYVLTPHGMMTHWDWQKQMLMKRIFFATHLRRAWRAASAIRYLSRGELERSMVPPAVPHVVIPNAIQCCALHSATRPASQTVVFLGRVTDQKGVVELIQAFSIVQTNHPSAQLIIVGALEGHYGREVEHLAAALGSGRVHVLGPVFGSAKYDLLKNASIFVTLSKNEGLSIAALEALSVGLPVVLTEASNLPEVEPANAGVITTCEPAQAARAISALLDDPVMRKQMGRNAKDLVQENFSWQAVLPKLVALYEFASKRVPADFNASTVTGVDVD